MDDLEERGAAFLAEHPDAVDRAVEAIGPDQLATLIYTSGTTGKPKGVRLRHSAWTFEAPAIQAQNILDESDLQFLWLPMAHSFGKVLLSTQLACGFRHRGRRPRRQDHRQPRRGEADLHGRGPPHLREGPRPDHHDDGQRGRGEGEDLQAGLPRRHDRHRAQAPGQVGAAAAQGPARAFDKLVFAKVRERFGGRVRFFISGSAALNRDIADWFNAAGILILEATA